MPRKSIAFNRICNLVPSRETERDWTFAQLLSSGALAAPKAAPASVDLRQAWWKIGDQGNTGSCVGWAAADGVMRHALVTAGRLAQGTPLSTRFVWMASKETDEFVHTPETFIEESGTSLKAAVDILRKYGAVTDATLPFKVTTLMYQGTVKDFYADAATRKASAYFNLGKDVNQWKKWLAGGSPILAGLAVDQTFRDATTTKGKLATFLPNTVAGGHAIAIVGYTAAGDFIIRNSWGTNWGDKGFGYATPGYIAQAFFAESYGIRL